MLLGDSVKNAAFEIRVRASDNDFPNLARAAIELIDIVRDNKDFAAPLLAAATYLAQQPQYLGLAIIAAQEVVPHPVLSTEQKAADLIMKHVETLPESARLTEMEILAKNATPQTRHNFEAWSKLGKLQEEAGCVRPLRARSVFSSVDGTTPT